jgi:hypothetical protein
MIKEKSFKSLFGFNTRKEEEEEEEEKSYFKNTVQI